MTADTTAPSYWLNWRFALCSMWVILPMAAASLLLWKRESYSNNKPNRGEISEKLIGDHFHVEECWQTCFGDVHPAWLLVFRIFCFVLLTSLLIVDFVVHGGSMLYFYTQWTFMLLIVYFGLGSLLSVYGCHELLIKVGGLGQTLFDTEQGSYIAPIQGNNSIDVHNAAKNLNNHKGWNIRRIAGFCSHIFQILFQICAGAVMLTDIVFWLIIFPFRAIKDYKLNFLLVGTHSLNIVFLLGDTALNSMPFPWFRMAYFILWTGIYVIFQWIIHACVPLWWPYPILDLSSPYAPIWYLIVSLLHIPCYALFALIMKIKHRLLSRRFQPTYQYCR